jgi:hypothetical protein
MASFRPIIEPHQKFAPSTADVGFNPNQRSEADDFIRSNGVTGEEIQEYNRLSKCIGLSSCAKNSSINNEKTRGLIPFSFVLQADSTLRLVLQWEMSAL